MVRKRAPGGGRKPQGEFDQLTMPFSLRMPEDLREQLEAAAKQSGRSTSQEILRRLNESFGASRDKQRDPAVRAICFLIAQLADRIRWASGPNLWDGNPFLFRAFKIGVEKLLDGLEPQGEIKNPGVDDDFRRIKEAFKDDTTLRRTAEERHSDINKLVKMWQSPKAVGSDAAAKVLAELYSGPQHPDEIKKIFGVFLTDHPSVEEFHRDVARGAIADAERTWYGTEQARRDLELSKPRKGSQKKS